MNEYITIAMSWHEAGVAYSAEITMPLPQVKRYSVNPVKDAGELLEFIEKSVHNWVMNHE